MIKRKQLRISARWGARLAGFWFILTGVIPLLDLHFIYMQGIMAVLAIAVGLAVLLDV